MLTYLLFTGLIMGPKNNKKVKNVRPTLPNPFLENITKPEKEHIDTLLELLAEKLKNIYPPPVTNKQVMSSLRREITVDREETFSDINSNKKEKKRLFKAKRNELRNENHSTLNITLREDITIGLKKCLKEMSANNICLLIFDSTVNLEPMRCIFEKGQYDSNIIGVPNLGDAVKKSLGFPSICIGFKNRVKEKTDDLKYTHFYPVVEFVNSFVRSHNKVSKSVCDIVSKEEAGTKINQTNETDMVASKDLAMETNKIERIEMESNCKDNTFPTIEILYRTDNKTRVFIPISNSLNSKNELSTSCDFISFSEAPKAKKQKTV